MNSPSVGELLQDASREVRSIMWEVTALDGPALGAAWPASFQKGPNSGPPPGADYSTVAYGLFEPFVLKQATQE